MSVAWAAGAMVAGSIYSANKAANASANATRVAGEAAANQLALDAETLDFYKQQYNDQKPYQETAAKTAQEVSQAQLASMKQNDAISKDYYDYSKSTFRPMEQSLVSDAQNYDTTERRDAKASQAVADVASQTELQRDSTMRAMSRAGVNPASGKMMAIKGQMDIAAAAAKAGAANKARDMVETQGWARKMDAASLGRGLSSSQATSAGVALNAGNSAVTNAVSPVNTIGSMTNTMGNGYSTAITGNQNAYDMINKANQNTANMWGNASTSLASGAGSMLGMYKAMK